VGAWRSPTRGYLYDDRGMVSGMLVPMGLGHGNLARAIPGVFLLIASYPLVAIDRASGTMGRVLFVAFLPMVVLLIHLREAWPPGDMDTSVGMILTLAAVHGPIVLATVCAIAVRALRARPAGAGA
jgi:hypothetical protein